MREVRRFFPLFLTIRHVATAATVGLLAGCASLPFQNWLGDGKLVQRQDGSACLELTPESDAHRVAACQRGAVFLVYAPGKNYVYKQKDLSETFRERLIAYLRGTGYTPAGLQGATVELWVVAPVFAPETTHFVAAVLAPGGNFSVELPLELADWRVETDQVALLGKERFPSREARQAGTLWVEAQGMARPREFASYLAQRGFGPGVTTGDSVVAIKTLPFGEKAAADRLLATRAGRALIAGVDVPHAGAKDAAMARALIFPLFSN